MKSLGVYYWYIKIPQCGYMEHGLTDVKCYVKKTDSTSDILL